MRVVEVDQMVATLLEDHDRPTRGSENVGDGRTSGSGADDDGVDGHALSTSASVQPRGWMSPSNSIDRHPHTSRLPPYSGGP